MNCPGCGVEVGRAQIICDGCGLLLMEERARIREREEAARIAAGGDASAEAGKTDVNTAPAETFQPGQELTPEQIAAVLGEEMAKEEAAKPPLPPSPGLNLSEEDIAQALKQPATPPPAQNVPPPAEPPPAAPPPEQTPEPPPPMNVVEDTPPPELSNIGSPDASAPTPAPVEEQPTESPAETLEQVPSAEEDSPPAPDAEATPEPEAEAESPPAKDKPKYSSVVLWILTLLIITAPVSIFMCWKSDWEQKRKVTFSIISLFYAGMMGLIVIILGVGALMG